ncbi:hypothetical protein GCM10010430_72950 [Kitasatospora cystarginea]|uniref:Integrase catalytic domain-containing protein n=1 Tax=Kitasatospora cystarginea TaxID=58350 RepID=A0ABP5RUM9_9ACTN
MARVALDPTAEGNDRRSNWTCTTCCTPPPRRCGPTVQINTCGDPETHVARETELIDRTTFPTRHHAEQALFAYIEGFYNPRRRHSANGQLSPAEFERRHTAKTPHRVLYAVA